MNKNDKEILDALRNIPELLDNLDAIKQGLIVCGGSPQCPAWGKDQVESCEICAKLFPKTECDTCPCFCYKPGYLG